jgi:hypothetical protein
MSRPEPKRLGIADFRVQVPREKLPGGLIAPAQIVSSVEIADKSEIA